MVGIPEGCGFKSMLDDRVVMCKHMSAMLFLRFSDDENLLNKISKIATNKIFTPNQRTSSIFNSNENTMILP